MNPAIRKCVTQKDNHVNIEDYQLGDFRGSMNNNPLLQKPQLGKSIKTCYKLPSEEFIFGKPYFAIDGGVAEAMIHLEKEYKKSKKNRPKNFMKLNAMAVKSGLVTSKETSHFRGIRDYRVISPEISRGPYKSNIPLDMTFGIPSRPSTPMFDVIEHKFQQKYLKDMRDTELAKKAQQKVEKKLMGRYQTRTALLRKFLPPVDDPSLWRMPKYTKTLPHLETFESPEKRRAAFKSHELDRISRRGLFGHGIYEPAKF